MSIEQKINGNVGKLFVTGEVDLDSSPELRDNIKDLIDNVKTIEVQLSKVNYIDSSGIAALVEGMQLSKSKSKEFFLTDVSNEVMKVIKLAHLDKIFKIKNVTGTNAAEVSSEPETIQEPEPQASENVDLAPNEEPQQQSENAETENKETEETNPSIKRDDDDGDKIKFKR
ncbi:STAS domain-containing protein [Candidatus Pelagibacter sp. HIMB1521]|uniref:STAS domain-containing protein n=1 Tax=Candidatus Pelagibacter sp. HIMB1521 TaxID=3413344 RepID=UPI003F87CAD3